MKEGGRAGRSRFGALITSFSAKPSLRSMNLTKRGNFSGQRCFCYGSNLRILVFWQFMVLITDKLIHLVYKNQKDLNEILIISK